MDPWLRSSTLAAYGSIVWRPQLILCIPIMTEVLVLWSLLWIELRVWVGSLFQHIALLQHHKLSLLGVLYSQLYNLLLLSGLWLTRTTCVSNCARGCESIHSGIGIVWLTHPNPKTLCRAFLSNGMGATTSVLLVWKLLIQHWYYRNLFIFGLFRRMYNTPIQIFPTFSSSTYLSPDSRASEIGLSRLC